MTTPSSPTAAPRSGRPSLLAAALLAVAGLCGPAQAADVGISIGISQPGVYGRIDIGRYPQPVLLQSRPVYVERARRVVEPVYLWVPPGHRKNWRKHCYRYDACGAPVYFVQDRWYQERVVHQRQPRWEERDERHRYRDHDDDGPRRDHGRGDHRGDGRGHGPDRGRGAY